MSFKKIMQGLVISCSILAIAGCSTTGKKGTDVDALANDTAEGAQAQTAGIDQGDTFGDDTNGNGASAQSLLAKRTYYFEFDKSEVPEADKTAIYANADYLIAHTNVKIILEGHTDPRGSREYNVALGERRANSVLELLKSRGVNPDQVRVVSYGAQRLAAPGRDEQAYQLDRRAIIVMQK
jgi:peptidoglycan-associated lipoprotein